MVWHLNHAPGVNQLLGRLLSANMNVTTDQAIPWAAGSAPNSYTFRYVLDRILVLNASIDLTTAAGGVYKAVSKPAGGIIVAAAQTYTALTGPTLGLDLTLTAFGRAILSAVAAA